MALYRAADVNAADSSAQMQIVDQKGMVGIIMVDNFSSGLGAADRSTGDRALELPETRSNRADGKAVRDIQSPGAIARCAFTP
jgi:hypothetical protein